MSPTCDTAFTLDEEVDFWPSSLYVVFLYRGNTHSWHSALFFASPDVQPFGRAGRIWHATSGTSSMSMNAVAQHREDPDFLYEETTAAEIKLHDRLILAVRIADLAYLGTYQDVANSIEKVVSQVPVRAFVHRKTRKCGEWLLSAIQALHDTAYLYCRSFERLDTELAELAVLAVPKYLEGKRFTMAVSEYCATEED